MGPTTSEAQPQFQAAPQAGAAPAGPDAASWPPMGNAVKLPGAAPVEAQQGFQAAQVQVSSPDAVAQRQFSASTDASTAVQPTAESLVPPPPIVVGAAPETAPPMGMPPIPDGQLTDLHGNPLGISQPAVSQAPVAPPSTPAPAAHAGSFVGMPGEVPPPRPIGLDAPEAVPTPPGALSSLSTTTPEPVAGFAPAAATEQTGPNLTVIQGGKDVTGMPASEIPNSERQPSFNAFRDSLVNVFKGINDEARVMQIVNEAMLHGSANGGRIDPVLEPVYLEAFTMFMTWKKDNQTGNSSAA